LVFPGFGLTVPGLAKTSAYRAGAAGLPAGLIEVFC
jgi:hypothetical protein